MIVIVDCGLGNVGSILNMLRKIGAEAMISSRSEDVSGADRLVLPGVGAFDHGMKKLDESGLRPLLERRVLQDKTPILGICLGMQMMTARSEEGTRPGLGWMDAETVRFHFDGADAHLKVPHVGWNHILKVHDHALWHGLDLQSRFYFVHSYHVACRRPQDVLTTTRYGGDFVSSMSRDNIMGVQFHPEKSHRFGMKILENFSKILC